MYHYKCRCQFVAVAFWAGPWRSAIIGADSSHQAALMINMNEIRPTLFATLHPSETGSALSSRREIESALRRAAAKLTH